MIGRWRSRCDGITLAEILVGTTLTLLALSIGALSLDTLTRTSFALRSAAEPRQQLRVLMRNLTRDFQSAELVFDSFNNTVAGFPISVPPRGGAGRDLAFAIPVKGGEYQVVVLSSRAKSVPDSGNPAAYEVVYHRFSKAFPPVLGTPGSFDLTTLVGGSLKVFDVYTTVGDMSLTLSADGQALDVEILSTQVPPKGATQVQRVETHLVMRNVQ